MLTPDPGSVSLATWDIALVPRKGAVSWPDWVPAEWHANASARGFALLDLLANPGRHAVSLPLSPELDLAVTPC